MYSDSIASYDTVKDGSAIYTLWRTALGDIWPIDEARFQQILADSNSQHFVAYKDGQPVGCIVTALERKNGSLVGYISTLFVAPHLQRKGVGSALYEAAQNHFRAVGVECVQLGRSEVRFWAGVPQNLPGAVRFFQKQGWEFPYVCYDLTQNLQTYATPFYVHQRMMTEDIRFELARAEQADEILAFEQSEFPEWLNAFQEVAELGDYHDILLARDQTGNIIGSLILYSPQSHPARTDVLWSVLLGNNAGALGCVGIAEAERGRGAGLALVAHASEILKERAVETCYVHWVVLTDFYGKLGYTVWCGYEMVLPRP